MPDIIVLSDRRLDLLLTQGPQGAAGATGPAGSAGADAPVSLALVCSNETGAIGTGNNVARTWAPYGFTIQSVFAGLKTASSSGPVSVDINVNGSTIMSTEITIDQGETTSATAATPPVVASPTVATNDLISIDISASGTGAIGLQVIITGVAT